MVLELELELELVPELVPEPEPELAIVQLVALSVLAQPGQARRRKGG
jgi:hypothetical protein